MADNMVTLIGNLGADPEVRRTTTGKDVVSFSLVTNERVRGADGGWTDGASSWFKVTAWGDLGVHAGMSFRKGQRVIASGVIRVETWKARDGGTGKTVELTAQALGHDLRWGTSTFARGSRPQQQLASPPERAEDDGWGQAAEPQVDGGVAAAVEAGPAAQQDPAMALAQPGWSTSSFRDEDETPF